MKTMLITPKDESEFRFLSDLFKKLKVSASTMTEEEVEDLGLSRILKGINRTKKVSKESIIGKLKM